MIPGQRKIRGIRDKINPGQLVGRALGALNARGHAHPLTPAEAKAFLRYVADEISNTSVVSGDSVADALGTLNTIILAAIADGDIIANISGGAAVPIGNTLSAILDHVLGNAQGDIIFRGASGWVVLTPGTNGQVLTTGGAAANPSWTTASTLPSIADGDLLANTSGSSASPVATTLTHLIDYVFGSTQGSILYRDASAWKILGPGTAGFVLLTNGAGANPSWSGATGISGAQSTIYPPFTPPVNGNYAWVNQGSASVTVNANGGIFLLGPTSATASARIRKMACPGSTPWTLTVAIMGFNITAASFQFNGICLREAATGKLSTLHLATQITAPVTKLQIIHWTNETTRGGATTDAALSVPGPILWLQITDDGTNLIYRYSIDGYNFVQFFSEARGVFFTTTGHPTEFGFFVDDETNTYQAGLTLLSWLQN